MSLNNRPIPFAILFSHISVISDGISFLHNMVYNFKHNEYLTCCTCVHMHVIRLRNLHVHGYNTCAGLRLCVHVGVVYVHGLGVCVWPNSRRTLFGNSAGMLVLHWHMSGTISWTGPRMTILNVCAWVNNANAKVFIMILMCT